MFDLIRNLIDIRFTGTHAIHAIVHKQNRRIYAITNFNISPRSLLDKSSEEFNNTYEAVYNLQKIINLNESLRPKMRARQSVPLNFIYQNDFIYEDMSVIAPELVDEQQLISEKIAAYDFLVRQINHMRREYNNISLFVQQKIYAAKASEAAGIVKRDIKLSNDSAINPLTEEEIRAMSPYTASYADAEGISLSEAAHIIHARAEEEKNALLTTENERVRMNTEIARAETVAELHESVRAFIERNKDNIKI